MNDEQNNNCNDEPTSDREEEVGGLRIRNVEEINSDDRKRKLPSWLTNGSEVSSSKQKRAKKKDTDYNENNSNEITSNGLNEENDSNSTIENLNVADPNELTSNAINSVESADQIGNNNIEKPESNTDSDSDEEVKLPRPIIKKEIKAENDLDDNTQEANSSTATPKPLPVAVKQEATSSTDRESCKYGVRCYRRNPAHRQEQAHPGDTDYKRPDYPAPPLGTPDCPYGDECYRRNPAHFRDYAHPPSTDFQKNWDNYKRKLRERKNKKYNFDNSDSDSSGSLKDFIADSDESEFVPDEETEELTEDFL